MHLPSENNQPELQMDENSSGKAKDCSEEAPRVPRRSLTEGEHGATCRSYFTPRLPFHGPEHLRTRRASLGPRGLHPIRKRITQLMELPVVLARLELSLRREPCPQGPE